MVATGGDGRGADEAGRGFTPRALGEIAIRCADLAAMTDFHRDVIGLSVLERFEDDGVVFFGLGECFGGHTAVLALFRQGAGRTCIRAPTPRR